MSIDVFLSYSSKDRAVASAVVDGLRLNELTVWWDHALAGERVEPEIRQRIEDAISIVALFSRNATSDWVAGERSRAGSKLVPVRIDDIPLADLPTPYLGYDFIDLTDWIARGDQTEFAKLIGRCRAMKGRGGFAAVQPAPPPRAQASMTPTPPAAGGGSGTVLNIRTIEGSIISTGDNANNAISSQGKG